MLDLNENRHLSAVAFKRGLAECMQSASYSYKELEREIGIDERTIKSHRHGSTLPTFQHLMTYLDFFGEPLAALVFEPIGLSVFADDAGAIESAAQVSDAIRDLLNKLPKGFENA